MPNKRFDDVRDGYIAVGRVLGAWGVRGDMKVEQLAPDDVLAEGRSVELEGEARTIERSKRKVRHLYLKLAGIDDRETAASLRGRYLEVLERDLGAPGEDTYYWFQLIGLHVESTAGEPLGELADIITTAGNDVFVVRGPRGEILVPGTDEIVQLIDVPGGRMVIEIVPGLLPDEPKPKRAAGRTAKRKQ